MKYQVDLHVAKEGTAGTSFSGSIESSTAADSLEAIAVANYYTLQEAVLAEYHNQFVFTALFACLACYPALCGAKAAKMNPVKKDNGVLAFESSCPFYTTDEGTFTVTATVTEA